MIFYGNIVLCLVWSWLSSAILDFQSTKLLTYNCASLVPDCASSYKLRENQTIRCRLMTQNDVFQPIWRSSAILNLQIWVFVQMIIIIITVWSSVPNFIIIESFFTKILPTSRFLLPPSWNCDDIVILYPVNPLIVNFHDPTVILKFHVDWFGIVFVYKHYICATCDRQINGQTDRQREEHRHCYMYTARGRGFSVLNFVISLLDGRRLYRPFSLHFFLADRRAYATGLRLSVVWNVMYCD